MLLQISRRKSIVTYGTASLITFIVFLWLRIAGHPLFGQNSSFIIFNFMQAYMLPLFFAYGILVGDFIFEIINKTVKIIENIHFWELTIVSVIAFLRISTGIPVSGHALIISFYILFEIIGQKEKSMVKILIGLIVLFLTIYVKITINDPFTFIMGIIAGTTIFIIGFSIKINKDLHSL